MTHLSCLHCALKALLAGEPVPTFDDDESPAAHLARCHPDLEATARERAQLEAQLRERLHRNGRWP